MAERTSRTRLSSSTPLAVCVVSCCYDADDEAGDCRFSRGRRTAARARGTLAGARRAVNGDVEWPARWD
jgi:hypothetical protein